MRRASKPSVPPKATANTGVLPLRQAQGQDDDAEQTNATAKANTEILSEAQNDDAKQVLTQTLKSCLKGFALVHSEVEQYLSIAT